MSNQAIAGWRYPVRLPLSRYPAWETLSRAIDHLHATHGTKVAHGVTEFECAGDWEAYSLLYDTRASLCTPQ